MFQEQTQWSKSGIHNLIKNDTEISGIWEGVQNNQYRRG